MANNIETIVLGSGKLYCTEFSSTIPEDSEIETDDNLLGLIQGGATLDYTPTHYTATDDFGLVEKTVLTKEEVKLKSGIITFNGNTLAKLCSTARVTETSTLRTVIIGGIGSEDKKDYVLHFVHEDAVDGDIRVTIVGKNESGFSLAFAKDKETVIDAEFKAIPHDSDGTRIIYKEEIKSSETATAVSEDDAA